MGTLCEIKVLDSNDSSAREKIDKFENEKRKIDLQLSFYNPKSRLSKINALAKEGFVKLSPEELTLLRKSIYYSKLTEGAFDITFYPIWELWKKSEKRGAIPMKNEINSAIKKIGYKKIIFSKDGQSIKFAKNTISINFGGVAKEYALIKCYQLAKENGIDNFLINLGGDIIAVGEGKREGNFSERGKGWIIAIQDPFDKNKIIGKLNLKDKIVLTSGVYQRFVEINQRKYHHIIDARSGLQKNDFAQLTIVGNIESNVMPSIVLFLMGSEKALKYLSKNKGLQYIIIDKNGKILSNVSEIVRN